MSFGYGVADLKGAIKLCSWMWENCFDKDGTADERYKRLKNSVKGLQDQVVRLHRVVETSLAERSYNPANPTDQDLQREFKDVAGDCIQTIDKCYKLLRNPRHVELDKNRAGIIKNIAWGATVQPVVDQLIRQLQFHIDRLQIILEPVKVGDLAIIRIAVLELLETSRRQDPGLIAQASDLVPGWLNDVFDGNARINVPLGVANILEIGVKDGCDLLYRAFASRASHDSSLDARACAIRRYLNILKCQWIINTLRKTPGFPKHRSGSAFSIFVSNIEVSLCHDLQTISRTPGASVSNQDLRNLFAQADRPFLIWNPPTLRRFRSPTEREVGEEHILTVGLASNGPKEELIFFKKGRTDFRLVPTEEVEGKPQLSPYLGEVRFNLCVDKFVARYAVGEAGIPGLIPMDLYLQGHTNPVTYHMKDLQDVWAFQRAMLGYEVIGNECNVRWTAQKVFQSMSDFFAKSRRVELLGCVQVWRWDPYQETIPAPGPDANRASVESPDSSESGTMTLSPLSTAPSQRTVSSFLTTESKIHGGVLEQLQAPTAPVIAAFGHSGGFYRSYVLQLQSNLIIDRSACKCTLEGDGGKCTVLVIQSSSSSQVFDIQDLSVPSVPSDSIKNWNLAVFRGPGRSAEAKNPAIVKHMSCERVRLDFDTPEERRFFSDAFLIAKREYTEALAEFEKYKRQLKHAGDRPKGPSHGVYGTPASSVASMSGAASGLHRPVSTASTAPRIAPVAAFSRLSLGGIGEEK